MRVALLALALGFALAGRCAAQATPAAASGPHVPEPLARLAWLLGDWDCSAVAADQGAAARRSHNHVTLAASGDAFDIATTVDGNDTAVNDVFGYDPARRQWYERSLVAGALSQDVSGDADALTSGSLTLLGLLRFGEKALRIRSTYSWSDPNAYRFEGAGLTASGAWQTLEVHECKRRSTS